MDTIRTINRSLPFPAFVAQLFWKVSPLIKQRWNLPPLSLLSQQSVSALFCFVGRKFEMRGFLTQLPAVRMTHPNRMTKSLAPTLHQNIRSGRQDFQNWHDLVPSFLMVAVVWKIERSYFIITQLAVMRNLNLTFTYYLLSITLWFTTTYLLLTDK